MEVALYDYDLPKEAIAQTPAEPRDASRLMLLDRESGVVDHRIFHQIVDILQPGDLLVVNRTRVIPARLYGKKRESDVAVEMVLLTPRGDDRWEVLVRPGRRLKPGTVVDFGEGRLAAEIQETTDFGGRIVRFEYTGDFDKLIDELGEMPLPPYIETPLPQAEAERYQTVYNRERGSAAAPTAGLHFTPQLLDRLRQRGIETTSVLLHVGLGTFRPVQVDRIEDHKMHSEFFQVDPEAAEAIAKAKGEGRRVIAVGTTVARTLETVASRNNGAIAASSGWTDIFIYPGYTFHCIDGMITNFHLPKSTLLMLVSAFAGRENILAAYQEALKQGYRFFSFGDAMLII
ncbi:tRNA preQ1(34) S-adenosylmethionine ribosyltransferase-isomerase QueA [Heliobacterium gestii]|uniref:S-adenosylmethionine:tRNA ribosyltransferase-isomerase n=1 Tax=Heliomicrobium gestii TaxID=2699 RepID=A0A845LM02_HELGE|nr:tRNA preQ1(34) S-adenosylmethionine ribosyltransferase-isomerase QueA [Heliomicrobium gestii]MBM7868066.1 S-adenosylmethionine:tRNA ribosyltransferase-isomerase [Heliomicrobium gestii]MZP44403.1 tRNA preQ1(34) S-adenosylmethionine ribosyltransferase-isomerase QueA [Heliomicrobium gestii]